MKSGSTALQNLLKQGGTIPLQHKLIAEWNYNRYYIPTSIDNNPALAQPLTTWQTLYPITSLAQPDRPARGIVRGFTNECAVSRDSVNTPSTARTYPVDDSDIYKYWISPGASGTATDATGGYPFATAVSPTILYPQALQVNKVVIGVENSFVGLVDYAVETSVDGSTWVQISHNPTINANGQIVLYYTGSGWTSTVTHSGSYVSLKGIRFKVNSINKASSYASIIEISPRREDDLTSHMVTWSANYDQSNISFLAPLGQISSNTGTVTLFNDNNMFDNDNTNSPYANIIDKNVKFVVQTGIDTTSQGGAGVEWVTELTMWSLDFSGQKTPQVQVNLVDSSAKLQNVYPPELLFEGLTAGQIIWRLMDIMGYSNYNYTPATDDDASTIPYYWTSGDTTINAVKIRRNRLRYMPTKNTLWEELNRIAEGTQIAIYFDCYDVMQIKTRKAEFNTSQSPVWTFRGAAGGGELPNIVDWQQQGTYESNHLDIQYSKMKISDYNNGFPVMETIWTPTTDTTLRATPLVADLASNGPNIMIASADAVYWPYTSLVNIDGEMIRYNGKEYAYYNVNNVITYEVIYDDDRRKVINSELSSSTLGSANTFTGKLPISERGKNGTVALSHSSKAKSYTFPYVKDGGGVLGNYPASFHQNANSTVTLSTNSSFGWQHNQLMVPSGPAISGTARYGARIMFRPGYGPDNMGETGLFFNTDSTYEGYYVSLYTSLGVGDRKYVNECAIWQRLSPNGAYKLLASAPVNVIKGEWYDIEAFLQVNADGSHNVSAMVDGNIITTTTVTGTGRPTGSGWGAHIGTFCSVEFEYLYATTDENVSDDRSTFMDMVTGAYVSGYADRNITAPKTRFKWTNNEYQPNGRITYFDDFGAWAHEAREFSVDFDKNPSIHSRLFLSNENQLQCLEYLSTPFAADFTVVNTARQNAVMSGADTLTFPGQTVNQQAFIYGRLVTPDANPTVITSEDADSIRRRGPINTTFNSMWIQTQESAQALADWIVGHWAKGQQEIAVTVFGARLLQVGDLITIDWPSRGFTAGGNKWFVTKVEPSFNSNGITDVITIRHANI